MAAAALVFELIYWTLRLIIYYPAVGLPLLAIVIIAVCVSAYRQHQNKDWDSRPAGRAAPPDQRQPQPDPDFSQPVFEDFAFRLFSTANRARDTAQKLAAAVGPYMNEATRTQLTQREPVGAPVRQVVVGALRVVDRMTPRRSASSTKRTSRPTSTRTTPSRAGSSRAPPASPASRRAPRGSSHARTAAHRGTASPPARSSARRAVRSSITVASTGSSPSLHSPRATNARRRSRKTCRSAARISRRIARTASMRGGPR